MTRRAHLAELSVAAVAVAGCASSGPKATSTTAVSASRAKAAAAAINLRATDVPGSTGAPNPTTSQSRHQAAQLAKCAGATPPSRQVADVSSDEFSQGSGLQTQQVSSDVSAMPTAHLAQRDLAAVRSPRAQACFKQFLDQMVVSSAGNSVQFGNAQIAPVTADAPGMDGSFGYRVSVTGTVAGGPQVTVYADLLGFARKSYEIDLNAVAVGKPIPMATEQHLFSLLVTRAGTAVH